MKTVPSKQDMGNDLYIGFSRFTVANGKEAEVFDAFRARPHRVDAAPGFVRMEVLQALDDVREFWLLTYWTDEASFHAWHRGHPYKDSHAGIPRGLRLVPGSTQVRGLRQVTE